METILEAVYWGGGHGGWQGGQPGVWKFKKMDENVEKEEVVNTVPDCNVIEEEASFEARAQDACTQTPQRRRGGGW